MKTRKRPRVLVAGGAGFIGTNIVNHLIAKNYHVRVMDLLIPPTHNGKVPEWFNKKAKFLRGDVRKKTDWEKALQDVSYVIHLAAYADVHSDFSQFIQTNVTSVALLYEIIREKKLPIKKIVLASSQSVYGEGHYRCPQHGIFLARPRDSADLERGRWEVYCPIDGRASRPVAEREDDPLDPITLYGVSKWALEKTAMQLGHSLGIPTVIFRYSIVHGPYQSFRNFYSGALREFSVKALFGIPLLLHEDGMQLRDFVHAFDVAEAHALVLKKPAADFQIFNVGSGHPVRALALAQEVVNAVGSGQVPKGGGVYRAMTPRHQLMNVAKLKALGWHPRRTLKDNARDYIQWMRRYPEALRHFKKVYRDMVQSGYLKKSKEIKL